MQFSVRMVEDKILMQFSVRMVEDKYSSLLEWRKTNTVLC